MPTTDRSPPAPIQTSDAPVRLLSRICVEYFLDTALTLADTVGGDVIKGLVFLSILRANIEHLAHDSEEAQLYSTIDRPPPDELRRPTTVYSVAKSLGLTYETCRRHVNWLIENDYCVRKDDGLVITAEILQSAPLVRGNIRHFGNFRKLMGALDQAGLQYLR